MIAPIGVPRAVEAVRPVMTTASVKPRFSGGTIVAAAPVAVGANIAAGNASAFRNFGRRWCVWCSVPVLLTTLRGPYKIDVGIVDSRSLRSAHCKQH